MSARFASPVLSTAVPANPNAPYTSTPSAIATNYAPTSMAAGPPPGLGYPQGLSVGHAGNINVSDLQGDSKVQAPYHTSECFSFASGEGVPGQSTERRAFSAEILPTAVMLNMLSFPLSSSSSTRAAMNS